MTKTDDLLSDAEDFVQRRRQQRTHYEGCRTEHVECLINDMKVEIERLRLTKKEREAIYRAEARLRTAYVPDDETAAALRSLLERLK